MAETDPYTQDKTPNALNLVVNAVQDCETKYHDVFVDKVERRYDAYRGLSTPGDRERDPVSDDDWHSDITAPYILQTVEGMLATMLEPRPRCDVKPRPRPDEPVEDVIKRMLRADTLGSVISYAFDRDGFAEKQRPFMQQDLIAGISVMKDYWVTERRNVTSMVQEHISVVDAYGQEVDRISSIEEQETEDVLVKDDACCEVRDVRDFFWPAQASSVDKAEYLIDRTYESYASCERKADLGYYKNVAKLKETRGRQDTRASQREMRLRNVDRTKDLVEVLEYWTPERVITVGNRSVVLNDRPNPFWNGRMPFIVCSAMPDGFQIPGISVVEALAQLQEMLWTLQNQRLDVLRMVANLITLVRSDVDDPEAFDWAPNAQWFVEDPSQVSTLPVDPTAATITLQAEALLKGDLQNIMGGLPMAGGVDSGGMDQETATGVSIITSIAQRIIQARKQHYMWAYAKLGKDFLMLWQQFVRDERPLGVLGKTGAVEWQTIDPMDLQGDFDVMIDATSDSLLRQERRAESQSLMQLALSGQVMMAQSGAPLNLRAFMDKVLDSYDVHDKGRYYMPTPPPQLAAAAPGAPPPEANGNGNGITSPAASNQLSPSAEGGNSMSPEASMARLMAQRGTPAGG